MSDDLDVLLSKENLEAVGKDFVAQVKDLLKENWDTYPEQVKKDIEATGKFAAHVALELAVKGTSDVETARKVLALESQVANIKVLGMFKARHLIADILEVAAEASGTFFQKALKAALAGGLKF